MTVQDKAIKLQATEMLMKVKHKSNIARPHTQMHRHVRAHIHTDRYTYYQLTKQSVTKIVIITISTTVEAVRCKQFCAIFFLSVESKITTEHRNS